MVPCTVETGEGGTNDDNLTVLAWLGGSLEALPWDWVLGGSELPLLFSLALSSTKLNRAGGLERSVGDLVLVLGDEEGGPQEGRLGGKLGA